MARVCNGMVRWSRVETWAERPAHTNLPIYFGPWPKTLTDFELKSARFWLILKE